MNYFKLQLSLSSLLMAFSHSHIHMQQHTNSIRPDKGQHILCQDPNFTVNRHHVLQCQVRCNISVDSTPY
jgi:hypothetical protein